MSAEILQLLGETTVATSAAIAAVLALRGPTRRLSGASAAYALWSMVPLALVAVLLPAATTITATLPVAGALKIDVLPLHLHEAHATGALARLLLLAWAGGALATLYVQLARQRAFMRGLGRVARRGDGLYVATTTTGLPAASGLVRGRIILPADFDRRYAEHERTLMLAHERVHLRRGDLQVNALALLLRCLFWFNPLLHLAVRCMRRDQELSCDQAVVARFPHLRRAYGHAMLKAQLATRPLPLGCHWSGPHPLKERIAMLKQPVLSIRRSRLGLGLVAIVSISAAFAAWAAQPVISPQAENYSQSMPGEIQGTPPRYPKAAADQKIGGRVMLLVDVAADGSVADVMVERSEPAGVFDQAALDAAQLWRFNPMIENGKPVAGRVRVPVDFSPEDPPASGTDSAPAGNG